MSDKGEGCNAPIQGAALTDPASLEGGEGSNAPIQGAALTDPNSADSAHERPVPAGLAQRANLSAAGGSRSGDGNGGSSSSGHGNSGILHGHTGSDGSAARNSPLLALPEVPVPSAKPKTPFAIPSTPPLTPPSAIPNPGVPLRNLDWTLQYHFCMVNHLVQYAKRHNQQRELDIFALVLTLRHALCVIVVGHQMLLGKTARAL